MMHPNLDLIDSFFAAYGERDFVALREVLAEQATWTFPGHHAVSGTHAGVDAIVALFDTIGSFMVSSNVSVEKLVVGANDAYVAECQHIRTSRADGPNLDQQLCVLWSFAGGKIVSGQHLAADQDALDAFYTAALPRTTEEA